MADLRARARSKKYDAIVIGAGPNGLAAAIAFARYGFSVLLVEARGTVGGGARTAELTEPGFLHDVCSAIHPTALASPFFRTLPLEAHGVSWIHPETPFAHPLPDGTAALCERPLEAMREALGAADGAAWSSLFEPLLADDAAIFGDLLDPLAVPAHPFTLTRFGLHAMRSVVDLANARFAGDRARALFAGASAHSCLPLDSAFSAAYGLVLALGAHAFGWPMARGGSQTLVDALASILRAFGGEIVCDCPIASLAELPESRAIVFDTSPRAMVAIAGEALPPSYGERIARFRYGPGVFKIDYALSGPIPWRAKEVARAATVHVCGTIDEVVASEHAANGDAPSDAPYVLVVQSSLFDRSRAPEGKHTGWAYCHVPNGCEVDMTSAIERQLERFAPGFRDLVIARHTRSPKQYEAYDANFVGGDIGGGANSLDQLFTRPIASLAPYATPNPSLYLGSSSTPPGGGVHGMCGWLAAKAALARVFGAKVKLPATRL